MTMSIKICVPYDCFRFYDWEFAALIIEYFHGKPDFLMDFIVM